MGKKEKLLDTLKAWHSFSDKIINAFMALAGFVFTSAGGLIPSPFWLTLLGTIVMVLCGFGFIFIQKKIKKLQKDLGDMK